MADREFVFGRADVQKILKENFVTVAADDWYQRRREDAVGEYFRAIADQGPRKGAGGSTRQGRYTFTASGKLLGYNNNRDPQRILKMLNDSLAKWKALPENERSAGGVKVPPLKGADKNYSRTLPEKGLVLKVHTRVLEKDKETGKLVPCGVPGENAKDFRHEGFGSATDHLWIKNEELTSWLKGGGGALPPQIAYRLARFHLVDDTRGEPPHWNKKDVRAITLSAERVPGTTGQLLLKGEFQIETPDQKRGYEGELRGVLNYDPKSLELKRLDLVAIGDHWGEGTYTRGARPGKSPLGAAFTLGDPSNPKDLVPPQAIRWEQGYWEADRH